MCELLKQLEKTRKAIEVINLSSGCRYHKQRFERYYQDAIHSKFKCLELFHTIYPKVLALTYGAHFEREELDIKCPNYKNSVTVQLYRGHVKSLKRRFLNGIKGFLHPIRPMDVLRCIVYGKVLSVEGNCCAGHKNGEIFEIYHEGTICPQALYSIFSDILISEEDNICQCPSHINRVVYRAISYE